MGRTDMPAVVFAPGRHILAAESLVDGRMSLWDVADPRGIKELAVIPGGTTVDFSNAEAQAAAFSLDGRLLLTIGDDRTARLLDITDPRRPREEATLRGHMANVHSVAFSLDGRLIATADNDHVVRLWETDVERIADRICEIAHPRISITEWAQYFPDLEYQPPCP